MDKEVFNMLHTIDYNEHTDRFQALFIHGTSSAALRQILENGLTQPNFDTVVAEVIFAAPWLEGIVNDNIDIIRGGNLGINARVFENDVIFATWLANWSGLRAVRSEIDRVIEHGGELYTVTWNRIANLAANHGLDAPPLRFPNAQTAVVLFKVDFDLEMRYEPSLRAKYRFLETMSQLISRKSLQIYKDIHEVKFLEPLPSEMIVFHGTVEEVADQLSKDLLSPSALAALVGNRRN